MGQEHPSIPAATYRLQFHSGFRFEDAREIVPYLRALGISHVYASPFFQARPGSQHGYDICDHNTLNPEVGTREEFDRYVETLRAHEMGQIADFVPNHMGIGEWTNTWWMDVLENGPSSIYAKYFDIDWDPIKEELENKVLLPVLGDQYGRVLEKGELKVRYKDGAFTLHYYDNVFPMAPRSYGLILRVVTERLAAQYGEDEFLTELRSIMTSLEHLPARTEKDPAKIRERAREKEVVKRRLVRLCEECPQVAEGIQQRLVEIQGNVGDPRSFDALDALVGAQAYRLAFWRTAAEEINYRRFFDINELAAIKTELAEVFEASHRLVFELIRNGAVHGLRIDHVDGLLDPLGYLGKLQKAYREIFDLPGDQVGLYLLVEKILMEDEELRPTWPVHGTTGYEFTNEVIRLLVDPAAERSVTGTYGKFIGEPLRFNELVYRRKQSVMRLSLASEINVLGHMLNRLSEKNRWYRDFTLNSLVTAVGEVIACFPVYRTYLVPGRETDEIDRRVITRAVNAAIRRNPAIERSIFDFLRGILLMEFPPNIDEAARREHEQFVLKLQQCTGPVMAKGLEDTSFYIFNRLVALNEVGGEPQRFGAEPKAFHEAAEHRRASHPHSMLATSTHDTKRSEDVRARIAAISELPEDWRKHLQRWRTANRKHKREVDGAVAPDANEEYLLYQTLLGSWPLEGLDAEGEYVGRIQDYMTKAIKEAKVNTSWIQPNDEWDEAVRTFAARILDPAKNNRFLKQFEPFAARIAGLGAINSLTQVVLKCTVPGVPDFYQGNELWDFSLVDPDNRRPVDYERRRRMLESLHGGVDVRGLLENWEDGHIKMFVTLRLLDLRRQYPELFRQGDYTPVESAGSHTASCVAFRRQWNGRKLIVIAPRLSARVGFPPTGRAWADTTVQWPEAGEWREVFTGEVFRFDQGMVPVAELLRSFPFAVVVNA